MWTKASLHFEGFSLRLKVYPCLKLERTLLSAFILDTTYQVNLLTWSDQPSYAELIVVPGTYMSEQGFKV